MNSLPDSTISNSAATSEIATSGSTCQEKFDRFVRRHDLDALRAIAMLLGIVLHAALSFAPIPWTVSDSQQNSFFYILFSFIHGFRMPLFFVLSGYFTAMLWRKTGLLNLIKHRSKRILLPLILGCFTIIPAMWAVSILATTRSESSTSTSLESELFQAVYTGDAETVERLLQNPEVNVDALDSSSGSTSLCTSVFVGHTEITETLIKAGADVNLPNRDLASPLHVAAFMGRPRDAKLLLDAGANVQATDATNNTPADLLKMDFNTTNFVATSLGVPLNEEVLLSGRKEIAAMMEVSDYLGSDSESNSAGAAALRGLYGLLFQLPVFMHLWFLSFLCWLVAAFAVYSLVANIVPWDLIPKWLIASPIALLFLVPLTMWSQASMVPSVFGPDSSIGLLPIPGVFAYYAIFFFFGAIYWDIHDDRQLLGRWWYLTLPVAVLIVFPIGLEIVSGSFGWQLDIPNAAIWGNFFQAVFVWLMIFGSIGMFSTCFKNESPRLRYISDSSYWLYLSHLPVLILAQWLIKSWEIPSGIKFLGLTLVVSAFLLLTYEYGVRYTWIGRLLNGPRKRPKKQPELVSASGKQ